MTRPMTSIRRTLLVWLLLGLVGRRGPGHGCDVRRHPARDRRALRPAVEAARLLDAHRRSAARPVAGARRRARWPARSRASPRSSPRSGTATACSSTGRGPACGLPVPVTEGYSDVARTAAHGASTRMSRATTRCRSRMRWTSGASSPRRPRCARCCRWPLLIPLLGVLIWYRRRPRPAPARCDVARGRQAPRPTRWRRSPRRTLPEELQPLAGSLNALLARLDDALAAQRRFTADAAHELRTPLAALALQVELADARPDPAARAAASPTSKKASSGHRIWSSSS